PKTSENFEVAVRIPGWAQNQPVPGDLYAYANKDNSPVRITVNGKAVKYQIIDGYAILNKLWKKGDVIGLSLSMPVRTVVANAKVQADSGRVALQRGPLVYCAEWPDNKDSIHNLSLDTKAPLTSSFIPSLLSGVQVIKGKAKSGTSELDFMAIPYYAWANRGKGEMAVWMKY
ncbi:MAG: glycoside hydrolase family 127 protein, partial [Bacteroidota bacterium]|nr:glycoside hydrolase family 127 protein [Bacteroidota bacterium]